MSFRRVLRSMCGRNQLPARREKRGHRWVVVAVSQRRALPAGCFSETGGFQTFTPTNGTRGEQQARGHACGQPTVRQALFNGEVGLGPSQGIVPVLAGRRRHLGSCRSRCCLSLPPSPNLKHKVGFQPVYVLHCLRQPCILHPILAVKVRILWLVPQWPHRSLHSRLVPVATRAPRSRCPLHGLSER